MNAKTPGVFQAATPSPSPDGVVEVAEILRAARHTLAARDNPSAALDSRLLFQHATGLRHETLIADPRQRVPVEMLAKFQEFLKRRLAGEPVSRIVGEREFYGRVFRITSATLDPRPDTETLIEAALTFAPADRACRIIDLGTGTGIIGVTLLAERPEAHAVMTDISAKALAVARENARRHGVLARTTLIHGYWFAGVEGHFDLILANPPYIPRAILAELAPEVRNFDPETALEGGVDGLRSYREIAQVAGQFLALQGVVVVEIGEGQASDIEDIFEIHGFLPKGRWKDLSGHVRCIGFSLV